MILLLSLDLLLDNSFSHQMKGLNNLKRKIKIKKNDLEILSPSDILLSQIKLSSIGLSKNVTIIELLQFFSIYYLIKFFNLSDSEIIRILVQHKGIGPWLLNVSLVLFNETKCISRADIGLKSISKFINWTKLCIKKQVENYLKIGNLGKLSLPGICGAKSIQVNSLLINVHEKIKTPQINKYNPSQQFVKLLCSQFCNWGIKSARTHK